MDKINSGTRLYSLLVVASKTPKGNRQAKQVWAEMFQIDPSQNIRTDLAVMEHLLWIQSEIEAILQGMGRLKLIPPDLYEPQLARVMNILGPESMAPGFDAAKNVLTPDVLNAVKTCAALLPDEENQVNADDLNSLRALATELEALLEVSTLPAHLQSLLRRHLDLIHRALDRYSLNGAKALREAVFSALGELTTAGDALRPYADSPEAKKLTELWTTAGMVADAAIKIEGLLQIGDRIASVISSLPRPPL